MSKEKQIEEIANMIYDGPNTHGICWRSYYERLAETIYNAGYRKQSEVVEEIFEKIDNIVSNLRDAPFYFSSNAVHDLIELKKEYTGVKEDDQ